VSLKRSTRSTSDTRTDCRYNPSLLGSSGPSLQPGVDEIKPSDQVRLLVVTIAADLVLGMHLASVCKTCFFSLRQVRRIHRSQYVESVKILVHSPVTS